MICTPVSSVTLCRALLEETLLSPNCDPEHLMRLSRSLDRLIVHAQRVRVQRFAVLQARCVRPRRRISCAIP